MSIIAADALPPAPAPPTGPLPKRGRPLIAWLVIAAAVLVAVGYEPVASHLSEKYAARSKSLSARSYRSELQIQGREIVGSVRGFEQNPEVVDRQIKEGLSHGPYEQRLRFVILVGELQGPAAALEQLSNLRDAYWEQHPPTKEEADLTELVEKLFRIRVRQFAAAVAGGSVTVVAVNRAAENAEEDNAWSLDENDRGQLRDKFDWFGELALAPPFGADPAQRAALLGSAQRTALVSIFVIFGMLLMAAAGFLLLAAGVLLLLTRLVVPRFLSGSRDGGVYAETFALWMVLYMVLEVASVFIPAGSAHWLIAGLLGLSSLSVLGWPVLRGVSLRRVRQDLGLWMSRTAPLEMFWGIGCYLATLPLVIGGVMASAGLLLLYKRYTGDDPFMIPPRPTHPISEILAHGSWWERLQIFFVAAVCAPIIEETMFRGVLYRHLREIGPRWPRVISVLFSAVGVSFVFAVIHPQGFLGVPPLMALAIGFAITRELRGNLLGSITAHGIHNALLTLIAIGMS